LASNVETLIEQEGSRFLSVEFGAATATLVLEDEEGELRIEAPCYVRGRFVADLDALIALELDAPIKRHEIGRLADGLIR
jgi:hypothetical protein